MKLRGTCVFIIAIKVRKGNNVRLIIDASLHEKMKEEFIQQKQQVKRRKRKSSKKKDLSQDNKVNIWPASE